MTTATITSALPLTFTLPFLTAGMNGKDGLIRQHFRDAAKVKNGLHFQFLTQKPRGMAVISFPVRLIYTRYTSKPMDPDNAAASAKHPLDALQSAGIIKNDSPSIIAEFVVRQVKAKRTEERTEIIIEHLNP